MTSTLDDARGELLALADEIEQSVGLLMMMPGKAGTRSLGIKKTAQVIAALRAAPGRCDAGSVGVCVKCGCETRGEVALVHGEEWCHSCADAVPPPSEAGREALEACREFLVGMTKPATVGPFVGVISSYHPCHALIHKIDRALSHRDQGTVAVSSADRGTP